jgi:hypothetical protein
MPQGGHALGAVPDASLGSPRRDRCTVEVVTWQGLVTYDVVLVMELATRRVHMAGITPHLTSAFMPQCGCSEESEQFSTLDETSFVNKHLQVLSTNAGILLANFEEP